MSFTFPKSEKLKSRTQITQLFQEGKSVKAFPLRFIFLPVETLDVPCKVGFSVPKRRFKKAVDRNRIKRLLRESYRLHKQQWFKQLNQNYVGMFVYLGHEELPQEVLHKKMQFLFQKFIEQQKS